MGKRKAKPLPRRRSYAAAQFTRLTEDWVTGGGSADSEIGLSLSTMRNRARQLARDSDYVRQAVRAIENNVIGTGVRMQAQVPMLRGGGRLDTATNDRIEAEWKKWCRADTCHTAGRLGFQEIERMAVSSMAVSGEVFIRLVRGAFGRGVTPLALEIIEADLLDDQKDGLDRGQEWRKGVRVDEWGRPLEYAFLRRHPGDQAITMQRQEKHRMIPAGDIIHLAVLDRPGQTRGVTWFAAALQRMRNLYKYEEAEIVRARTAASLMGYVTSQEGELLGDEVAEEQRLTNFEPGVFKYLNPGEQVSVPQLDAPDGQFEPFVRSMLRAVAAGVGVAYSSLSRDYSQSNYSSSRLELLEDRENWKALQQYMIGAFHQRVFEEWLDAAVGAGVLSLPGYDTMPDRYRSVRWMPRGWAWVDPVKEVDAYREAIRCGFKTLSEVVAEGGGDLEELLVTRKAEVDRIEELGLSFDTDTEAEAPEPLTEEADPDPA